MTFTDKLRNSFGTFLNKVGELLYRLGLTPNLITIIGMLGNLAAGFVIARGHLQAGGWIVLIFGPLDALDGTLARLHGDPRPFGALLDSLSDRISEIAVMFGLLIYFLNLDNLAGCVLVFAASTGSIMVSYVRARAQSLGCDPKVGFLTRVERYLVTALSLVFNQPVVGLWILAFFTYVTVFQRVWFAWKELH